MMSWNFQGLLRNWTIKKLVLLTFRFCEFASVDPEPPPKYQNSPKRVAPQPLWATALKCLTKLISSDYEQNLVRLSQLTSSDLDYTVRRAGIQCIMNLFTQYPVEAIKVLHSQDTEPIVHDTSPILQFKRPSVRTLMALLELLAFDDDWEVKMTVIKLIDFVYWKEKKSKAVAQMVDLLQEMTRDCDPHVAEQAQVKLSSIMDLGKLLSIGRNKLWRHI